MSEAAGTPAGGTPGRATDGTLGRTAAGEGAASGPSWLGATVFLTAGQERTEPGWQRLDELLAPDQLQARQRAVSQQLSPLAARPEAGEECAWALVALNLTGWILAPATAYGLDGLRPRSSWPDALRVRAQRLGPLELGICTDRVEHPVGAGGAAPGPALADLAALLAAGLQAAGAPRIQVTSALASTLNTLAAELPAHLGGTEALVSWLWEALVRAPARLSGRPGSGQFRRPACCGLVGMSGDPRSACGDCPRSHRG
ncbi:hypothetical protein SAMN05443377_10779 [Propionibacterium cyclohexanicum]|uniref:FhuF 2Fe-2S C-terminal domain-containing protein n=1 Tax=Propionibacterium cyclohexanicum TaxID=64702 RepID=A0A1H9RJJ7_9ACTN|nr:hypothetical protein [Propionibacterium cyclohexanicum]SER72203.1 hypothetical protein SAMN05443377_10779 [Propionibacterium cyclohexanicum]